MLSVLSSLGLVCTLCGWDLGEAYVTLGKAAFPGHIMTHLGIATWNPERKTSKSLSPMAKPWLLFQPMNHHESIDVAPNVLEETCLPPKIFIWLGSQRFCLTSCAIELLMKKSWKSASRSQARASTGRPVRSGWTELKTDVCVCVDKVKHA